MIGSFITEAGKGYDRNHGPIPHINAEDHRVKVDGLVENELDLSVKDLEKLEQKTIICAL